MYSSRGSSGGGVDALDQLVSFGQSRQPPTARGTGSAGRSRGVLPLSQANSSNYPYQDNQSSDLSTPRLRSSNTYTDSNSTISSSYTRTNSYTNQNDYENGYYSVKEADIGSSPNRPPKAPRKFSRGERTLDLDISLGNKFNETTPPSVTRSPSYTSPNSESHTRTNSISSTSNSPPSSSQSVTRQSSASSSSSSSSSSSPSHLTQSHASINFIPKPLSSQPSTTSYKPSTTNTTSSSTSSSNGGGADAIPIIDSVNPRRQVALYKCEECGRSFKRQSFAKHQAACARVFGAKRDKFDSQKQRLEGEDGRPITSCGNRPSTSSVSSNDSYGGRPTTSSGRSVKAHDDVVVGGLQDDDDDDDDNDDHIKKLEDVNEEKSNSGDDKKTDWRSESSKLRDALKKAKKQASISGIDMGRMGHNNKNAVILVVEKPTKPNIPKPVKK